MPLSKIREATGEAIAALIALRGLDDAATVSPEELSAELIEIIERARVRARRGGYSSEEIEDITYALVATVDEIAVQRPGPIAQHWASNLLQMRFFSENVAGDVFFVRLERLLEARDGARGPNWRDVLQVYFLCLSLGFQGRYKIRGGEGALLETIERARSLAIEPREGVPLSPRGERPDDRRVELRRSLPLIIVALAVLLGAALVYLGLRVSLNAALDRTERCIAAVAELGGDALSTSASLCAPEGGVAPSPG